MPKKFSSIDKRKWLELFEGGKTEKLIATRARCDLRTVKRGIEEARLERDARTARAELLKDALKRHQDDLLAILEEALANVGGLPVEMQSSNAEGAESMQVELPWSKIGYDKSKGWAVTLDAEATPQWELLREHVKRDAIWGAVDRWKKALIADLEARIAMRQKAAQLLVEKTKYKVVDDKDTTRKKPFLFGGAVDFVYRQALNRALGIGHGESLEGCLEANPSGIIEERSGTIVAYVPGSQEECRKKIIEALEVLCRSAETEKAHQAHRVVEETLTKAKRSLRELSMLKLVPGQCRVCRRLGM
jgi:hypothetical protein